MIADAISRMKLTSSLANLLCPLILVFPSWAGAVMMLYSLTAYGRATLDLRLLKK